MKVDPYLSPSKKLNLKWIKFLRLEILKPLEENVGNHSENDINTWPMGPHEIKRFLNRRELTGKHTTYTMGENLYWTGIWQSINI